MGYTIDVSKCKTQSELIMLNAVYNSILSVFKINIGIVLFWSIVVIITILSAIYWDTTWTILITFISLYQLVDDIPMLFELRKDVNYIKQILKENKIK